MANETLVCARCGKPIADGDVKMGLPLITAQELARTAFLTPGALFGAPLGEVPYCSACRPIIAKQRTNEQLKVLVGLLIVLALIGLLLFYVIV